MKADHNLQAKKIVNQDNFFIKKKFSQNFLLDENIIKNIIEQSCINKDSFVIEIGPGLGALTKHIATIAKKLLIYEVDKDLIPILNKFFGDNKNVIIINQDFLKADVDRDINQYLEGSNKVDVISNLPYHITTPIIMKILEESQNIKTLTLMMQLEVARRLTSKPNNKDYNALSIIIQDQTEAKFLFKVPKTVFKPKPQVDSAVIFLDRKKHSIDNPNTEFYIFVHKAFAQRRKTLVNNLSDAYREYSKEYFKNLLERNDIIDTIRGEALSLDQFKILYEDFIRGD